MPNTPLLIKIGNKKITEDFFMNNFNSLIDEMRTIKS
jgi:hypothetical protein